MGQVVTFPEVLRDPAEEREYQKLLEGFRREILRDLEAHRHRQFRRRILVEHEGPRLSPEVESLAKIIALCGLASDAEMERRIDAVRNAPAEVFDEARIAARRADRRTKGGVA